MTGKMFFVGLAGALCLTSAAQAQELLQLAPTTPWALDYADDSCQLVRTFGADDHTVTLGLTAYEPGGRFQLSAVGALTQTFRTPPTVKVAMGDLEEFAVRYLQADFGGTPGILITNPISVGPLPEGAEERLRSLQPVESYSDPEFERLVTTIGFVDGFEREFVLQTGSMAPPLQALKECNAELITHWDIDVAAHENLSRIAYPSSAPFRWLQWRTYPREMRQPMMINWRLIVDAEGNVAGCHVAGVEDDSEFSVETCEQLRDKARFDPALDADGEPVRSYFVWAADMRG